VIGKPRGFTLVEMVVALTILSLIVLATVTGMRTLAKTQQTLEQRSAQVSRMRAVQGFVRNSLEQLQVVSYNADPNIPGGIYFLGLNHELIWTAPAPIPGVEGGLWAMRLSRNDSKQLVLQVKEDIYSEGWGEGASIHHTLADEVSAFEVTYRALGELEWQAEWPQEGQGGMPRHIKIQLTVSGRYWPELIVAITGLHNG